MVTPYSPTNTDSSCAMGVDTKSKWKDEDDKKLFHNGCKIKNNAVSKTKKCSFNYISKLKLYLNFFYQVPRIIYFEGFAENYFH